MQQGDQIWYYTYNNAGDCIQIVQPNGQIIKRLFDMAHRLLWETQYQVLLDGAHYPQQPKTKRYVYDEKEHLRFTIAADGTVSEYRYDEEGLVRSARTYLQTGYAIDGLDETNLLSLDALETWAEVHGAEQLQLIDYLYDWRGQLIEKQYRKQDALGNGLDENALITRYRYDAQGRLMRRAPKRRIKIG